MNAESKGAALKAAKAKAQKTKGTPGPSSVLSRPASSAFDITKPHWTLKWVSDATCADSIDIKKDTDRIEEIKALKRAWESHEIGRSAKAMISRSKFLKENMIKVDGGSITDEENEKSNDDELNQTIQQSSHSNQLPTIASAGSSASSGHPSQQSSQRAVQAQSKAKQTEDTKGAKVAKGGKKEKDKAESTKASSQELINQTIEQANETVPNVEEILMSRPPTPPKPKNILPPIEPYIEPFLRYFIQNLQKNIKC